MDEIRFRVTSFDSRLSSLSERVPDFVAACLAGVDRDQVASRWVRVVTGFVRGAAQALRVQGGAGRDSVEAAEVEAELCRGFGMFEVPRASYESGAEQDGFDSFMDWLSNPDAFGCTRLRDRLARASG